MAGLSRDILKWVQSLDLSYSVKNTKRDFSNGFLVAEIFCRYYPADVQMHSFDNGINLQRRLDNWTLLERFFKRASVPINRDMIDAVIHQKPDAAVPLLEVMYTFLTQRAAPPRGLSRALLASQAIADAPPFAKPTAAIAVAQAMQNSELASTLQDIGKAADVAANVIAGHNANLLADRAADPSRYATNAGGGAARMMLTRGPPRPVVRESEQEMVHFQAVQVKPLAGSVARLRATQAGGFGPSGGNGSAGAFGQSSQFGTSQLERSMDMFELGSDAPPPPPPPSAGALELIAAWLADAAPHLNLDSSAAPPPPAGAAGRGRGAYGAPPGAGGSGAGASIVALPDLVASGELSANDAARLLTDLGAALAPALAKACAYQPRETWALVASLAAAIGAFDAHGAEQPIAAVVALGEAVGARLSEAQPYLADAVLRDHVAPRLCAAMTALPRCRGALLRLLYGFTPPTAEARIGAIKLLQAELPTQPLFLEALSHLVELDVRAASARAADTRAADAASGAHRRGGGGGADGERVAPGLDQWLLDLYSYYAVVGLCKPAPSLRAGALHVLRLLALLHPAVALLSADRLAAMAAEPSQHWEVAAALAALVGQLLGGLEREGKAHSAHADAMALALAHLLRAPAAAHVRAAALLAAAPALGGARGAELVGPFLHAALALSPEHLSALTTGAPLAGTPSEALAPFALAAARDGALTAGGLRPLPSDWAALVLAQALLAQLVGSRAEHLSIQALILLLALAPSAEASSEWSGVFYGLKEYLFVSLADEPLALLSAQTIGLFCDALGDGALASFPTLGNALLMVFPHGPDGARAASASLLLSLARAGGPFPAAVRGLLGGLPREVAGCSELAQVDAELAHHGA